MKNTVVMRPLVRSAALAGDCGKSASTVRSFSKITWSVAPSVLIGLEKICTIFAASAAPCAERTAGAAQAASNKAANIFLISWVTPWRSAYRKRLQGHNRKYESLGVPTAEGC